MPACKRLRVRPVALGALACCLALSLLTLYQTRLSVVSLLRKALLPQPDLFAVVVSISVEKQVAEVRTLIRYWESERWPNGTLPCSSRQGPLDNATTHAHPRPDLIIYTAQPLNRSSVRQIRRELRHAPRSRQCFHQLRFVSADLTDAQNVYNRTESGDIVSAYNGPLIMFTELAGHPALRTRYRYALYMEPDAVPIRGNFLAAVADAARWALANHKLTVQSGCTADVDARDSGWRNGSPALYRMGDEAADFFRHAITDFGCNSRGGSCGFAWDIYLATATGFGSDHAAEVSVSCLFHHAGSLMGGPKGQVPWNSLQALPFCRGDLSGALGLRRERDVGDPGGAGKRDGRRTAWTAGAVALLVEV